MDKVRHDLQKPPTKKPLALVLMGFSKLPWHLKVADLDENRGAFGFGEGAVMAQVRAAEDAMGSLPCRTIATTRSARSADPT